MFCNTSEIDRAIYLKLTNDCQLCCAHCYNAFMHNKQYISDQVLDKAILYIKNTINQYSNDHFVVQLHGGEPMLYDTNKINHIIDCLPNIDFTITTNLVFKLNSEKILLLQRMKVNGLNIIQTSWDYAIRFKNDKQQQLWLNNCKKLIECGVTVQPTITLTNKLINNIKPYDLINQFKGWGFTTINFERLTETGRAQENNLRPNNRELDEYCLQLYKASKTIGLNVALFEGIEQSIKHNYVGCRTRNCNNTVTTINPDGSISHCPNIANYPTTTIIPIKNIKLYDTKAQDKLEKNNPMQCLSCRYYQYCRGDCYQLHFDDTGCNGLKMIYDYLLAR